MGSVDVSTVTTTAEIVVIVVRAIVDIIAAL